MTAPDPARDFFKWYTVTFDLGTDESFPPDWFEFLHWLVNGQGEKTVADLSVTDLKKAVP